MNINKKKILIFLITFMLYQFQIVNLKAAEVSTNDEEELPAIDPFAGGLGSTNQAEEMDSQISPKKGLLNNMRLVGTILSQNKKIAIFSAADGGAYKYVEGQSITDTTIIIDIFADVVIVQDGENKIFEVFMNNRINLKE